jgi:predicted O-methyltransferase YrrM
MDITHSFLKPVKKYIWHLFYTSILFRQVCTIILTLIRRQPIYELSHLTFYKEENALGPIQRDEALFLFALVKVIRPKVVVEFGFSRGHSALNFLMALPPDAIVYSYDISENAAQIAGRSFNKNPNFKFIDKPQENFSQSDLNHQQVDLIFFDAAHKRDLNIKTFLNILPLLTKEAIIIIHDTGIWNKQFFSSVHSKLYQDRSSRWLNSTEFIHQRSEREFVNWLGDNYPEFSQLHLHSKRTLRHGFTILQRRQRLQIRADDLIES